MINDLRGLSVAHQVPLQSEVRVPFRPFIPLTQTELSSSFVFYCSFCRCILSLHQINKDYSFGLLVIVL